MIFLMLRVGGAVPKQKTALGPFFRVSSPGVWKSFQIEEFCFFLSPACERKRPSVGRHNEGRGRKINGISLICRNCAAQSCSAHGAIAISLNFGLNKSGSATFAPVLYLSTPLADNPGRIS